MARGNLVICDIDLDLLEKQRITLQDLLANVMEMDQTEEEEALSGVVNMLNHWSDEMYHRKEATNQPSRPKD
jgi:hypothetical protein